MVHLQTGLGLGGGGRPQGAGAGAGGLTSRLPPSSDRALLLHLARMQKAL